MAFGKRAGSSSGGGSGGGGALSVKMPRPFISLIAEMIPDADGLMFKRLDLALQPLNVNVDLAFVFALIDMFWELGDVGFGLEPAPPGIGVTVFGRVLAINHGLRLPVFPKEKVFSQDTRPRDIAARHRRAT